ncbi:MAG: chorismate lyase [Gammaproteobacteria bacterium]|nr:chorismate lyase [Gammaproteobacteria bacterium]
MTTMPMFLPQVISWLNHKASITDKLKALADNTHLEVLNQNWEKTDNWDHKTLHLPLNSDVLHRDILMWADNQPCWYARTILPKTVYNTEKTLFERLNTEALGDLIHNHPHIKRTHINPYEMRTHMPEYRYLKHALKQNSPTNRLWGRVSTFTIHHQFDFYLLEILLPGLLRYCP